MHMLFADFTVNRDLVCGYCTPLTVLSAGRIRKERSVSLKIL